MSLYIFEKILWIMTCGLGEEHSEMTGFVSLKAFKMTCLTKLKLYYEY